MVPESAEFGSEIILLVLIVLGKVISKLVSKIKKDKVKAKKTEVYNKEILELKSEIQTLRTRLAILSDEKESSNRILKAIENHTKV